MSAIKNKKIKKIKKRIISAVAKAMADKEGDF